MPRRSPVKKPLTREQKAKLVSEAQLLAQFLSTRFVQKPSPEALIHILEDTLRSVRKEFLPLKENGDEIFPHGEPANQC